MSDIYIVSPGESIWDVCLNSTGSLSNDTGPLGNLDAILEANAFEDWTEILFPGQLIVVPDTVQKDLNTLRQLASYPVCNNANSDIAAQIDNIFDILANNWILDTGFWNDNAIWIDTKTWID